MKALALALSPLVFAAASGAAQTSVSAAGGLAVPVGTIASSVNSGYNASVALNSKPPLAAVGLRLEAMFNAFGFKANTSGSTDERIMAAMASATLSNPETPLRTFYLVGGVGAYRTEIIGGGGRRRNNDVGFNVGLGLNLSTGVGAFVEVRYHHVPSEDATIRFIPITFGLRF